MRLLFMMAQPYFPQQAGGMQIVSEQLAQAFEAAGHDTAVAAELSLRSATGALSGARLVLGRRRYLTQHYNRRPVFRVRNITANADALLDAFQPDCVLLASMDAMQLAQVVNARGVPLVVCWHDVYTDRMGGDADGLVARFVANSAFTASVYQALLGVTSTVIPPLIRRPLYQVVPAATGSVTFINPVPDKGLQRAIDIATRCPDIPFEFVESWVLPRAAKRRLLNVLANLPNVRYTPRQTDMRPIYARTRILLAPSQCREGWGRVASEAQVSGIPVVGSRLGGLIEAIGPGGMQIEADAPTETWCDAVRSLWTDAAQYARVSAQARAYSLRPEIDAATAVDRMLGEARAAIALRTGHPATARAGAQRQGQGQGQGQQRQGQAAAAPDRRCPTELELLARTGD